MNKIHALKLINIGENQQKVLNVFRDQGDWCSLAIECLREIESSQDFQQAKKIAKEALSCYAQMLTNTPNIVTLEEKK